MSELQQFELLAQIDHFQSRVVRWEAEESSWEPVERSRAILKRVLGRVQQLRLRLEAPLVVATFGGTGTGKSSLVNALLGEECTPAGRQRPTTRKPILIAHPKIALEALGLPIDQFEIHRREADLLRDIVLIDCPDPDTSEGEAPGSNLARLHALLPHCDALLYVSTQQKYRSARVQDELRLAAPGCRLLFVQTHADLDEDIRQDWRRQLQGSYEVPDLFFVDSQRALREQQAGQYPSGDMGRLRDLLTTQLTASERVRVRRANVVDLLGAALGRCRALLQEQLPNLAQVEAALQKQREATAARMANSLREELLTCRGVWERRLTAAVAESWGFSPFSAVLRIYQGLGGILGSLGMLRARNSLQMALVGLSQTTRWLEGVRQEQNSSALLDRLAVDDAQDPAAQEAEVIMAGYVRTAQLDGALIARHGPARQATQWEQQFLGDARARLERMIQELATANSGRFIRIWYEIWLLLLPGAILYRIGRSFFEDLYVKLTNWHLPTAAGTAGPELLTASYYVPAAVFCLIWTGILIGLFVRRLRRGLKRRLDKFVSEMVQFRLSGGMFPQVEAACADARRRHDELEQLTTAADQLRNDLAVSPHLGSAFPEVPAIPRPAPPVLTDRR